MIFDRRLSDPDALIGIWMETESAQVINGASRSTSRAHGKSAVNFRDPAATVRKGDIRQRNERSRAHLAYLRVCTVFMSSPQTQCLPYIAIRKVHRRLFDGVTPYAVAILSVPLSGGPVQHRSSALDARCPHDMGVSLMIALASVLAAALLVYLGYALIRPEKF
ncbi:MAG TPA: potassium-transporting ATPase subunit F [Pararobbsia sp.]|nr:potassium-transporting ATPase subunit F [Pararobbsia sp.]